VQCSDGLACRGSHAHTHIYVHTHTHIYIYIYIYIRTRCLSLEYYRDEENSTAGCNAVMGSPVEYNQNDETISRNSLMYMSQANSPIALT